MDRIRALLYQIEQRPHSDQCSSALVTVGLDCDCHVSLATKAQMALDEALKSPKAESPSKGFDDELRELEIKFKEYLTEMWPNVSAENGECRKAAKWGFYLAVAGLKPAPSNLGVTLTTEKQSPMSAEELEKALAEPSGVDPEIVSRHIGEKWVHADEVYRTERLKKKLDQARDRIAELEAELTILRVNDIAFKELEAENAGLTALINEAVHAIEFADGKKMNEWIVKTKAEIERLKGQG